MKSCTAAALIVLTSIAVADIPEKCPACGRDTVIGIVYGEPSREMMEKAQRGEIILGGCNVDYPAPRWECKTCKNRERLPLIQFRLVAPDIREQMAGRMTRTPPTEFEWVRHRKNGEWILVEKKSFDVYCVADVKGYKTNKLPSLIVSLYPDDAKRFHELTGKNVQHRLAVFVLNEYCCAPVINAPILGGAVQIECIPLDIDSIISRLKLCSKKEHPTWKEAVRRDINNSLFWVPASNEKTISAENLEKMAAYILSKKPKNEIHGSLYGRMPYYEIPGTPLAVFLLKTPGDPETRFQKMEILFKGKTRGEAPSIYLSWNDGGVVTVTAYHGSEKIDKSYLRKYAELAISQCHEFISKQL